ncbi:MAG: four helix bundle protein [Phycisphaerae bacterium]
MGKGFEDLKVYQEARVLRRRVYRLIRLLPPEERFILFPQMRKAALSVTNCIAEGHGCGTYRHNKSYMLMSRGSVRELMDDLNTCEDERYFKKEHLDDLRRQAERVLQLLRFAKVM